MDFQALNRASTFSMLSYFTAKTSLATHFLVLETSPSLLEASILTRSRLFSDYSIYSPPSYLLQLIFSCGRRHSKNVVESCVGNISHGVAVDVASTGRRRMDKGAGGKGFARLLPPFPGCQSPFVCTAAP